MSFINKYDYEIAELRRQLKALKNENWVELYRDEYDDMHIDAWDAFYGLS